MYAAMKHNFQYFLWGKGPRTVTMWPCLGHYNRLPGTAQPFVSPISEAESWGLGRSVTVKATLLISPRLSWFGACFKSEVTFVQGGTAEVTLALPLPKCPPTSKRLYINSVLYLLKLIYNKRKMLYSYHEWKAGTTCHH